MAPPKTRLPVDPQTRLANAALKLLAKTAWQELTLISIARSARLSPAELRSVAGSKSALFGLLLRHVGQLVMTHYRPEPGGEAHDRLFDVAMCWFDMLAPHKQAARSLYEGLKRDPLVLIAARGDILEAANWLLILAEADSGRALPLRAFGLAAALGRAMPIWLEDGPDMARTMASLDTDLRRGETILGRMRGAGKAPE